MENGYALALHGSMGRDLDLVAIPWTDEAVAAEELVERIRELVDGFIVDHPDHPETNPTHKPHGRLAWAIHVGAGAYIDLSVMPRIPTTEQVDNGLHGEDETGSSSASSSSGPMGPGDVRSNRRAEAVGEDAGGDCTDAN